MKTGKATPRPWTNGELDGITIYLWDEDQDRFIAEVKAEDVSTEVAEANARLIVRAVNSFDAMREALKLTVCRHSVALDGKTYDPYSNLGGDLFDQINEALTVAEGRL